MIVRVLTARAQSHHAARLNELFRAKLVELQGQPGLVYAKLARRFAENGDEEIMLFEEWRTPSHLWAWTEGRLGTARIQPGTDALVDGLAITHYEALDMLPDGLDPGATWTDRPDGTAAQASGDSSGR